MTNIEAIPWGFIIGVFIKFVVDLINKKVDEYNSICDINMKYNLCKNKNGVIFSQLLQNRELINRIPYICVMDSENDKQLHEKAYVFFLKNISCQNSAIALIIKCKDYKEKANIISECCRLEAFGFVDQVKNGEEKSKVINAFVEKPGLDSFERYFTFYKINDSLRIVLNPKYCLITKIITKIYKYYCELFRDFIPNESDKHNE